MEHFANKVVMDALSTFGNATYQNLTGANNASASSSEGDDRFLTREETSKLLHVNFSTLHRWEKTGYLPNSKVDGRRVMYRYADVMAVLSGQRKKEYDVKQKGGIV